MWKVKEKPRGKKSKMRRAVDRTQNKTEKRRENIWNPKNLQKEVHAFGYDFYWKTYLIAILCMLLLFAAVGIFFRLEMVYIGIVAAVALLVLPILIRDMYRRMFEQRRFSDVTDYMEQMLYSFQKEHTVLRALQECYNAMPEGMMKHTVEKAIRYAQEGQAQTEAGALAEALQIIEKKYECEKLHMVHEVLVSAESRGGDVDGSIELLIEDIEVWKRQVYQLQSKKKDCHADCIASIIVAALMCGADMYIMEVVKGMVYAGDDISIFRLLAVQISSFVFLLFCVFTFYRSNRKLTGDWLIKDRSAEEGVLKSYQYVMEFNEVKESKKSRLFALVFLVAAVPCYIWLAKWAVIPCILIAAFMLVQHRFSYDMCRKDVKAALYMAFPEWMMDMALLLQTNNVQVAIQKSIPKAEKIMRGELLKLIERIKENPDDVQSYTTFCEKFDVPEIASCMKMLYAVSEAGSGNAKVQIENLVRHVQKFQERETEKKNEDISMKTRMICYYPIAATTCKMLVDMTAGTLLLFSVFQYGFS